MSISTNEITHNFWNGHILEILEMLPDEIFDCAVTSPPYWGLRDYGLEPQIWDAKEGCEHEWGSKHIKKTSDNYNAGFNERWGHSPGQRKQEAIAVGELEQGQFCTRCNAWRGSLGLEPTPELYVKHLTDIFREVRRVLRADGTLWLNLGDSYCGGGNYRGCDESTLTDKQRSNRGAHGELAIGRTGAPPPTYRVNGLKPKDLIGIPWRIAFSLQADGWYLRSDIIWSKPNPMPESVGDRPTKAHEYMFLLSKNKKYYFDQEAVKEKASYPPGCGWIDAKKGEISGKHSKKQLRPIDPEQSFRALREKRNIRSVWSIPDELWNQFMQWYSEQSDSLTDIWHLSTRPFKGAHFAVFPPDLIRPCILAGCPENGTVLDPFSGAGTVAVVCKELNRNSVGIELNPEYIKMAKERIEHNV